MSGRSIPSITSCAKPILRFTGSSYSTAETLKELKFRNQRGSQLGARCTKCSVEYAPGAELCSEYRAQLTTLRLCSRVQSDLNSKTISTTLWQLQNP